MQNSFLRLRRLPALVSALAALWLLTGCQTLTITNMTPDSVPANPSQIYTITTSVQPANVSSIDTASIKASIIIDGQRYPMTKSLGADIWEFDYQLPIGRTSASYYFIVESLGQNAPAGAIPTVTTSDLQHLNIAGRYVLRAEANRAPVGARVSVLGAGFTPSDVVYFESIPTRTVFESPSSISFFVPAVDTGKSYNLRVLGGGTALSVGTFRVDVITFTISPNELTLRSGEQQAMTFTIPQPAPAGGMYIDVKTDIPECVVMPEVVVPAGQTSVTVAVQGGKPGTGSLYFKSSAGESSVTVTVTK